MYLVSFIIGLIIVISSIFLIRREFNRAVRSQKMLLDQSKIYNESDLFTLLEGLQLSIDEMNRAFYDIADDLEGKYSIHEKEIRMVEASVANIHQTLAKITRANNSGVKDSGVKDLTTSIEQATTVRAQIDQMNTIAAKTSEVAKADASKDPIHRSDTQKDDYSQIETDSELIDQIIALRSQGKQLPQIAKELGIGMGELQLLIALKK